MYRMAILCGALLLSGCNYEVGDIPRQRSSVEETEVARERPVARTVGLTEGKTQPAPQKPQTQPDLSKDKLTPPARGAAPEAFALLRIYYRQPMILSDNRMHTADLDEFNLYKRTQQVLVTSDFVIRAALRKKDISDLPMLKSRGNRRVRWLSENIQVDFPGDAEIMRIGMSGENVNEMVRLVNAIVDAYLQEVVEKERSDQLQRLDRLRMILVKNNEGMYKKTIQLQAPKRLLANLKRINARINDTKLDIYLREVGDVEREVDDAERAAQQRRQLKLQKMLSLSENESQINKLAPGLESLKLHLANLKRFNRRINDELSQLDVNVKAPSRVFKLQDASR